MPDDKRETTDDAAQADGSAPETFEGWLEQQPAEVKARIDEGITGLKAALSAERESRKGLEKQLREAAARAVEGSEARAQLEEMATAAATASKQAEFYEQAHAHGITDLRLAWLAAQDDGGEADFEALKAKHPSLFANGVASAGTPRGDAGAGTGAPPSQPKDINQMIRDAARRR